MSIYTNIIQALISSGTEYPPSLFSCLALQTSTFHDILLWHPSVTSFGGILPWHPSVASFRDILLWHPSVTSFHSILLLHPSIASFRYILPLHPSITSIWGIFPLHPSEASFRDILYPSTPSYFILFSHLVQRVLNLPFSPTHILIISIHLDISFILLTFFIFQFPPTYYNKKP